LAANDDAALVLRQEEFMKRQLSYQLGAVIAATLALGHVAQAAGIGTIVDVVNEGYRTPPGARETDAKPADELVQDEALRTEDESTIQVRFVDGSELSVEAASEVVLSDYVYDGQAANGLINLNDGLFHFTSNGQPDQGIKLRTPVATIGIRGTEFLVHVDGSSATVIDILSGAVEATPHGKGKPTICYEGQSILVGGKDEDALCGDIGSFTTAVGTREDKDRPDPGHGGQDRPEREKPAPDPAPDPDPEPDPDTGDGNEDGNEGGGSGSQSFIFDEELDGTDFG
jgi:hypothetical protein